MHFPFSCVLPFPFFSTYPWWKRNAERITCNGKRPHTRNEKRKKERKKSPSDFSKRQPNTHGLPFSASRNHAPVTSPPSLSPDYVGNATSIPAACLLGITLANSGSGRSGVSFIHGIHAFPDVDGHGQGNKWKAFTTSGFLQGRMMARMHTLHIRPRVYTIDHTDIRILDMWRKLEMKRCPKWSGISISQPCVPNSEKNSKTMLPSHKLT